MAFIKPRNRQGERRRWPLKYVRLDEGKAVTVQVLEEEAVDYYKFWVQDSAGKKVPYISPGFDNCPLTQRNISVGKESSQYIRPGHKYAVNVWETTSVVRCKECKEPHRADSLGKESENLCTYCSANLDKLEPEPYNEVRILERGEILFTQLSGFAGDEKEGVPPQVMNSKGERLKIIEYPITIIRSGSARSTSYAVIPHPDHADTVDVAEFADKLHKLPDLGLALTPEEVLSIVDDAVPLSEILSARNPERGIKRSRSEDDTLY